MYLSHGERDEAVFYDCAIHLALLVKKSLDLTFVQHGVRLKLAKALHIQISRVKAFGLVYRHLAE